MHNSNRNVLVKANGVNCCLNFIPVILFGSVLRRHKQFSAKS